MIYRIVIASEERRMWKYGEQTPLTEISEHLCVGVYALMRIDLLG